MGMIDMAKLRSARQIAEVLDDLILNGRIDLEGFANNIALKFGNGEEVRRELHEIRAALWRVRMSTRPKRAREPECDLRKGAAEEVLQPASHDRSTPAFGVTGRR